MKNPILVLLTIFTIITGPKITLSMHHETNPEKHHEKCCKNKKFEPIKLDLKNKVGFIQTYSWCCQKAKEYVREKREKILKILDISEKEWKEIKKPIQKENHDILCNSNDPYYKCLQIKFPDEIKESILKTIENANVKKLFEKIELKDNLIGIKTKNNKKPSILTKFLAMPENLKNLFCICSNEGYNVFIFKELYFNAKNDWLKKSSLECQLGHELAHILCEHCSEKYCFIKTFEKLNKKINEIDFKTALKYWDMATEVQADIFGLFNNKQWARDQYNCYKIKSKKEIYDPNRLPLSEIANYFKEICDYMESDLPINS